MPPGRPHKDLPAQIASPVLPPIGLRVRRLRERKGYSLRDLGAASGLTQQAIGSIEAGRSPDPKISTILRLAAALGCKPGALAFGD